MYGRVRAALLTPSIALSLLSLPLVGYVSICIPKSGSSFPRFSLPGLFPRSAGYAAISTGERGERCRSIALPVYLPARWRHESLCYTACPGPPFVVPLSSPCPRQRSPGPGPCLCQGAVSSHGTGAVQPSTFPVPGALRGSAPEEREPSGLQASQDPPKAGKPRALGAPPGAFACGAPTDKQIFEDHLEAYEPDLRRARTSVEARLAANRPRTGPGRARSGTDAPTPRLLRRSAPLRP